MPFFDGLYNHASTLIEASVLVIAALFPIVNPIGSAAVFLTMVGSFDLELQRKLTKRIAVYSFVLLFVSMLCGGKILSFFGISLYSVQIGGGIIVAANGWHLLTKDAQKDSAATPNQEEVLNQAFYPYTLPITVGPGSISVAVALGAHLPNELHAASFISPYLLAASIIGCAVIALLVYICYRWARTAAVMLGKSGTTVLMRLSSFISFCIGVQILASGVRNYIQSLH
ncbi:MarC family protein [Acidicapsa ligni]|uniref:MarC family protein n=1 Tax=Acidicapsa ligni TaxID=542300 RepID=UPI0021E0A38A|nr:MarC family protein [Acidicapsa ligni]